MGSRPQTRSQTRGRERTNASSPPPPPPPPQQQQQKPVRQRRERSPEVPEGEPSSPDSSGPRKNYVSETPSPERNPPQDDNPDMTQSVPDLLRYTSRRSNRNTEDAPPNVDNVDVVKPGPSNTGSMGRSVRPSTSKSAAPHTEPTPSEVTNAVVNDPTTQTLLSQMHGAIRDRLGDLKEDEPDVYTGLSHRDSYLTRLRGVEDELKTVKDKQDTQLRKTVEEKNKAIEQKEKQIEQKEKAIQERDKIILILTLVFLAVAALWARR